MSLFDSLIGSTSTGRTSGTSTQDEQQAQSKQTTGSQVSTGSTQTAGQQSSTSGQKQNQTTGGFSSSLDPATIALVTSLIPGIMQGSTSGSGDINAIAAQLRAKAATPAISDADIAGQQSAAVTSFNQGEAVDNARLTNAIGSKNNTYSALVHQKGQEDLSSTLGGIVANAKATNAQISTQQLTDAVSALVQGGSLNANAAGAIANIIQSIKGGNTVTGASTTGDTTASENLVSGQTVNTDSQVGTSQIEDTIANLTSNNTNYTKGTQGSGLLGLIF
jgi:hypothetical protein